MSVDSFMKAMGRLNLLRVISGQDDSINNIEIDLLQKRLDTLRGVSVRSHLKVCEEIDRA